MLGKLHYPIASSRTALVLLLCIVCWGLVFGAPAVNALQMELTDDSDTLVGILLFDEHFVPTQDSVALTVIQENTTWQDNNWVGWSEPGQRQLNTIVHPSEGAGVTIYAPIDDIFTLTMLRDINLGQGQTDSLYDAPDDAWLFSEATLSLPDPDMTDEQWFVIYDVRGLGFTNYRWHDGNGNVNSFSGDYEFLVFADDGEAADLDYDDFMAGLSGIRCVCDSVKYSNHFTLVFEGVTYNTSAGTSKWDYNLTWDGTPPELSHFDIELCALLTNDNLVSTTPSGASIGPDGSTGLYGIKWDDITGFPANTPVNFSFTLDQMLDIGSAQFAPKAGPNSNIATICGPTLDCEVVEPPCSTVVTCPSDTAVECDTSTDPSITGYATAIGACSTFDTTMSCECDGGIKIIDLQTSFPYPGGVVSIEARAARKDRLDTDPYGIDIETFDGTTMTSTTFSGGVAITRIEAIGGQAVVDIQVDATKIGRAKLHSEMDFRVSLDGSPNEQRIHCSCSQPIAPPFVFGDFTVLGFIDRHNNVCSPTTTDCDSTCIASITFSDSLVAGPCPDSIFRTWIAVDSVGNADTCVQLILVVDTIPPVCSVPNDTTIYFCEPAEVCLPVSATDDCDTNVFCQITAGPGSLAGGNWCYTPTGSEVVTVTIECQDDCDNTCEESFTVTFEVNSPPVATCPDDDTLFVCDLSDICIDGFACDDPDGNVVSSTINGSPFAGGSYCFTPVEGDNVLTLICTDTCGVADTCQTVIHVGLNSPPVATCPDDDTLFVCDLSDICIDGFACDDPDGNVVSSTINGIPFGGGSYCFTPVEGDNVLTLICTDTCDVADTCQTVIHVGLNSPPVATCPDDDTMFVCDLSDICIDGFSCDDPDDNVISSTINGSPFGGGSYCFTPVEGDNVLTLICTDTCGVADTCETVIHVGLNSPPVATCPDDDTLFVCDLSDICIDGFACDDPDGNVVSSTINGSPFAGGSYCFTPVEGDNILTLICTDTCGVADTCQTTIYVELNTPPVATCADSDTLFICELSQVCIPPFYCYDTDGNLASCEVSPGTLDSEAVCFTPVEGANTITLIATDSCGAADTCQTTFYIVLNTPPVATCPGDDSLFVCDLSDICVAGFSGSDPNGNLQSVTAIGGTLSGDTVCFTPVEGMNTITLIAADSCGVADTCQTNIFIALNSPPVATCADSDTLFMCELSEVCIPPFYCYDTDGNLASCEVSPGTLDSEAVCFTPVEGTNTITLIATDSCGATDTCQTTFYIVLNRPPQVSCPNDSTIYDCVLPDSVCLSSFSANDPDGNMQSCTLNGEPYTPGTPYCIAPNWGVNILTFACSDSCGAIAQCTVHVAVVDTCVKCPSIVIEKTHKTIQGTHEFVDVIITSGSLRFGGFDFLIAYDASALTFQNASEHDPDPLDTLEYLYDNCNWEYFTYRYGPFGNCGNQCPSGLLRVVGMAEINNGAVHPSCFTLPPPFALFTLDFLVTNDLTFECQYVPIHFFWMDCGDNSISSKDGDTLLVSENVYDYGGGPQNPGVPGPFGKYLEITDMYAGFPTYTGVQAECLVDPDGDGPKLPPIQCIDFYNGGIDIVCVAELDDRGDINLNGNKNEIADAVMFTNYFIYGLGVFHLNQPGQIAATDVNADGLTLSVADLVYLIRVIVGDALPYPKLAPVAANYTVDRGVISVDAEMGAAYVVVEGDATPSLLVPQMQMKYNYDAEQNVTRVLVFSLEGNGFSGEFLNADGSVVSLELGSYEGAVVKATNIPADFTLNQNYPNPFNPTTTISFNLSVASDYTLTMYNVTGQQVAEFSGRHEAGTVSIEWNASDMASGVYFYRLQAGQFDNTKKMILLK